ncbi:MAG: TIGR03619 family F420-dependent LLM class oxidoreductase [Streptosporangiaceae bacterium]
MKIGFAAPISGSWATPDIVRRLIRRAEDRGYHSTWTFQRLLFPTGGGIPEVYRSVQDPIVTLSYLAGQTSRIRLGLGVVNMPFVSPTLLAKQLASLDILSSGRLDVGLGLGWSKDEFIASGAPYAGRGRRAEEFMSALRTLWTETVVEHRGDFYELPPAQMNPKPVQRPHPPILLGASAEPALRRAGRLADGWISSSRADLTALGGAIATVKSAARAAGRDPERLRFVCRGVVLVRTPGDPNRRPLTGSLEEIKGDFGVIRDQGVTELFLDLNYDPEIGSPDADADKATRRAEDVIDACAP